MKNITIKDMTSAALGVAILAIVQVMNNWWHGPGGYSPVDFYFPLAMIFFIMFSWRVSILIVVATPFLWYALGGVQFSGWSSFFLDYFIPLAVTILIKLNTYRKSIPNIVWVTCLSVILVFLRLFFHIVSGVVNFETTWAGAWSMNFPIILGTLIMTPIVILFLFPKALFLRTNILKSPIPFWTTKLIAIDEFKKTIKKPVVKINKIHSGYTNVSYKVFDGKHEWQVRIPKQKVVNWDKESKVYSLLYSKNKCFISKEGILIKEWIKGNVIKKWDQSSSKKLFKSINEFHKIKPQTDEKLNFMKYKKYINKLDDITKAKYEELINKYKNEKLVYCHNDINKNNVISDGENLSLIDFEWSCYAPEYFEYAQLKVTENITLNNLDSNKLEDYEFLYKIYAYLWTFEMPFNYKIYKLRKHLKK